MRTRRGAIPAHPDGWGASSLGLALERRGMRSWARAELEATGLGAVSAPGYSLPSLAPSGTIGAPQGFCPQP